MPDALDAAFARTTRDRDRRVETRHLLVAMLGRSMAFLDGTVVSRSVPVMQRELSMSVGVAQWVVEAYALMLASLVLVGGALARPAPRTGRDALAVGALLAGVLVEVKKV